MRRFRAFGPRDRHGVLSGLGPVGVLAAACGWALLVHGCPANTGATAASTSTTVAHEIGSFHAVGGGAPITLSGAELLELALAGLAQDADAERAEGALGSRMQVRPIRIPRPARGASARFNFGQGQRGWITALPRETVLTSPAYGGGKVFLGGGFSSHHFFAFDALSGDLEWSLAAPDGGPTAAIYRGGDVIFNTESCTIFVADAETGALRWKRWLGDPLMSQPAAVAEHVLSAYPANGKHRFGSFALADGSPEWSVEIPADIIQAPHVVGEHAYFATMDGTAFKVRWSDGHIAWHRDIGASSAPWVDRGHVLFSRRVDRGGRPFEEPVVLSEATGRIESRGAQVPAPYLTGESRDRAMAGAVAGAWGGVPHGQHLGLRNVASGWAFQGSSPAVADGRAYFAVGSEIRARDVESGEIVWRRSYAEAAGAQAISPPAVIGSQLVFGTVDGHLFFSDIDTGMTVRAWDVGEPIVFQPIVAQGWVYLATGAGNLIGLEIGDPHLDGWHMWGGNARHAGLVESAGDVDPRLLASLELPTQGSMRLAGITTPVDEEGQVATDATPAPPEDELDAPTEPEVEPDLPLLRTRVAAEVSGMVARVTVTQTFENPHDAPIEGLYLFPLPDDAAVDDMEMHIGRRVIRAHIRRRGAARRVYEAARASGRRAALLEQQRPNLFAQRVANIPPGESVEVQLSYVQLLPYRDGGYELVYPMIAPPRSTPGSEVAPEPATVRDAASVELSLRLDAGLPLRAIESPTHRIESERDGNTATVRLAAGEEIPNRDFVLRYVVGGETPEATVLAHRTEEQGYLSLVVQPPTATQDSPATARDLTFVVDTSSSMKGRAMEHARAVMRRALGGVRQGDTFNVLGFSDGVSSLAPNALSATEENLERALAFVDAIRAVGATDMVPAIEHAFAHDAGERLQMVVLVTDGFIGDEADVLRVIAEGLGERRVYTVGVGAAVNRFLLERAAEIGRGRSVVATLTEDPELVAERFFAMVDRPIFTDVEVDWGGLQVSDAYPRRLPDLFSGMPLVVNARFEGGGTARVKVRGTLGGRRYERAFDVTLPTGPSSAEEGTAAHATLWARAAVRDRMNSLYLRDDAEVIEEITQLGLDHRMVTQWTSFVAVDETPVEVPEETECEGDEECDESGVATRATVSPARSLPGDPEIRIPAPADALAVTVVLPFGETASASYEHELGQWTVRFLVPNDAEQGTYPIDILVTHADGRPERLRVWYTVDASAPLLEVEVEGEVRPGAEVTLRARQTLTEMDLLQVGRSRGDLDEARAQLLNDARRVEARFGDEVVDLSVAGPGTWEATITVPEDVGSSWSFELVVVDLAANVRIQPVSLEVAP